MKLCMNVSHLFKAVRSGSRDVLGVGGNCSKSLLWPKPGSHTGIAEAGTALSKSPRHCAVHTWQVQSHRDNQVPSVTPVSAGPWLWASRSSAAWAQPCV